MKIVTYKSLDELVGFGFYKEKTISELIQKDPEYVVWMQKNTKDRKIGKRLIKIIETTHPELADRLK